jgi:hypothetical protein
MFLTALLFYARALWHGELHFCDKCGELTQCLMFGEQMELHWKAVGRVNRITTTVPVEFLKARLCINCDGELAGHLNMHAQCCKPLTQQWHKDNNHLEENRWR